MIKIDFIYQEIKEEEALLVATVAFFDCREQSWLVHQAPGRTPTGDSKEHQDNKNRRGHDSNGLQAEREMEGLQLLEGENYAWAIFNGFRWKR